MSLPVDPAPVDLAQIVDIHVDPAAFTGTVGVETDGFRKGVIGSNTGGNSFGFLAGDDLVFRQHAGVYGESDQQGVFGHSTSDPGTGVFGHGPNGFGVRGETSNGTGVQGQAFGNGIAVAGKGGSLAGRFEGDVEVTGDIRLTTGQDCAEDFDVAGTTNIEPGTVMVIQENGALRQSDREYDKKVAGVVSGAGEYKPAIVLGRRPTQRNRIAIALLGKVYCKVDARFSPIEVGDLLTTSATPGHAMKASDPARAIGTLIGKALCPFREGQGLIPILVALQ